MAMAAFLDRQVALIDDQLRLYVEGKIDLNSLVHRLEALVDVIDDDELRDGTYESLGVIEEINASVLCGDAGDAKSVQAEVSSHLEKFSAAVAAWRARR